MAEKRPQTLDEMGRIGGVGAKKLERFGDLFLSVILGAPVPEMHPARRKLASSGGGDLFDRLQGIHNDLARGDCGTLKPMSLTASQITKIVKLRPSDMTSFARIVGDRSAERFGPAMIEAIHAA